MTPNWSRAIVVGASSGMGAAIVRLLAADGVKVAAVARRPDALEKLAASVGETTGRDDLVITAAHDVRDVDEVPVVFERLCAALGGIDLIVYAAGTMPRVGPQEFDAAVDVDTVAVNLTGAVAWLDA